MYQSERTYIKQQRSKLTVSATFHYLCLCKQFVKLLLKIKRILLVQKQLKKKISIKTETENKQQHENISFVLFINYVETTFGFFTIYNLQ